MRNFFKAFLAFLVLAIIAQLVHNTTDQNQQKEIIPDQKLEFKKEDSVIKKDTISVKKDSIVTAPVFNSELSQLHFNHKFITSSKHARVILPKKFFYFNDSIFNFLNKNQGKELVITGDYLKNEVTKNSNLGIKRANHLKNKLVAYGVNPDRIITKSNLTVFKYGPKGYYVEGIKIEHQNMDASKLATINKKITNKTLYSNFGNQNFKPDRTLYGYMLEVKNYLEKNPSSKISVIGHTDNVVLVTKKTIIGLVYKELKM